MFMISSSDARETQATDQNERQRFQCFIDDVRPGIVLRRGRLVRVPGPKRVDGAGEPEKKGGSVSLLPPEDRAEKGGYTPARSRIRVRIWTIAFHSSARSGPTFIRRISSCAL